jgi:osmotically-inducible protein OsmY
VTNGIATLTGTVGSWSERQAATKNAYDGGATLVSNDLTVDYD